MLKFIEILTLIITDRKLKWLITIMILKKLGNRYSMSKIPGGKLLFIDKQTKQIKLIPTKNARHLNVR